MAEKSERKECYYSNELFAQEYDDDRFGSDFGSFLENEETRLFSGLVCSYTGRILDVGAGTGKLSFPLSRQNGDVTAMDASLEMLRIARQKGENEDARVKFLVGDAHELSFKDKSFECVVSSRVLMHLVDWRRAISEFCRIAKKGVVLDFPPRWGFAFFDPWVKRVKKLFFYKTQIYKTFSVKDLRRELERNGFKVLAVEKSYFLPVALHRFINHSQLSQKIERVFRALGLVKLLGAPVTIKAERNYYLTS